MIRSFKASLLVITALAGVPAIAQDADGASDSSNTIIVTARKTSESLQEAPTSVSVVTAESIERLNIESFADLSKATPGLIFDEGLGRDSNRPVIRGQANILGDSGVAYFIDGIYFSGSIADYDVDQMERVEVVKGPQSALYGRNTYSGAINIITRNPSDRFSGRLTVDISENDRYEVTGSLSGPIGGGLSGGIFGRYYDFGGEFTNQFDGTKLGQQESYSVSGLLAYDNGGPFRARLRGYYAHLEDGQPALFSTRTADNNCFFDRGTFYRGAGRYMCGTLQPRALTTDFTRQFRDPDQVGLKAETNNVSLKMEYDLSDRLTITSLSGYNRRYDRLVTDGDYSDTSFQTAIFALVPLGGPAFGAIGTTVDFSFAGRSIAKDWSQEVRLDYKGDGFSLMVGGYYFDQSDDSRDIREVPADALARAQASAVAARQRACAAQPGCFVTVPIGLTPAVPQSRNVNNFDIRNVAIFGSATFNITDKLTLSAEGRYAEEKVQQETITRNAGQPTPAALIVGETFKRFDPRVTLDYKLSRDNLLYAIYATGQKPGGFNGPVAILAGVPSFDVETVESFEIGSKNQFLNGMLTANVALFLNNVEGYQLTQNVRNAGNTVSAISNAGDAEIKGLEFELQMRPSNRLTLTANYAMADSRFKRGIDETQGVLNDVADDGLVNCSTGRQFPDVAACTPIFGSIRGNAIPRAPKHQVFADIDYRAPLGGDWEFFAGSNVTLISNSWAQVHNLLGTGDSTVVDARIGAQNDTFRVQFYVRNLFDEDAVTQILRYADGNDSLKRNFVGAPRPGRRFGVNFTGRF
ncbi:TonB-dependent receptor [Blastomonas sp.]|uniref:TonB-dependent receptor n=1 Tax=Blastomonas sp. TaxID=1909299 RepID=UPI0035946748